MVTINIDNSYSRISGLAVSQEKDLRNRLSYTVGGSSAYFSGYGIHKKSLLNKRGEFPTGLIPRVKNFLENTPYTISNWPKEPKLGTLHKLNSNIKPYEWQENACQKAISVQRGTISACTGTGKALLIAMIAARLNVKTLVVVPTVELKKQLSNSLIDALGRNHKVTVRNIDSSDLPRLKDFDCLIIDEAHHAAAKTYQKLNKTAWTGIYYRYFLTATPFRNDTEETLLFEAIAGQVIYKLDYREAIRKGYIVPIEAYYIDLPKQNTDAFTYQEVYKELVVNNSSRNEKICQLLHSLDVQAKSSLCLVKEVQHGKNIDYPEYVHGQDDDSRSLIAAFNENRINCLIATTGIMGEGIDSRPCEYVIIAGLGKAKSQFMQQVGRAIRRYPGKETAKVIIFRDASHKYLLRHFNIQKKVLIDEYGVKVVKLDL